MGVESGQRALLLPKVGGGVATIAAGGFWLPKAMAQRLHVEAGDPLELEWAYSSRTRHESSVVRVDGLLDISFSGMVFGEYRDVRRRFADRVYPEGAAAVSSDLTWWPP